MTTEETTSMQLLADFHPNAARGGACYLCNAGRRGDGDRKEGVVDLGVSIDMEGFLQICETCAREIGQTVGLVDPADLDECRDLLAVANGECQRLQAERDEAVQLVAALRSFDDNHADEQIETPPDAATLAAARAATAKRTPRPKAQP